MSRAPAIPIAPNVWRIPTIGRAAVNTYAFVAGDGSVTLVDAGVKRAPKRITAGLAAIGKAPSDVTRIVLTHVHTDHVGGAAELSRRTGATVSAHANDAPYAAAGRAPTFDQSVLSARIMARLMSGRFEPVDIESLMADGDVLDVAGGLRVIHTPGHSPGHVSLLHEPTGVLVTGDALFHIGGLRLPMRFLCWDFRLTEQTVHALGELEYDVAAFTHGPEITERARERVRGFLMKLRRPEPPA